MSLNQKTCGKHFHYLFEPRIDRKPGFEIFFRIEAREDLNLDEIEKIVIERIDQFLHLIDGKRITREYHGEASGFGQDGWGLTKQLFEIGSEIAMGQLSGGFRKGEKFSPGKLVHCFLNQHMVNEEMFHATLNQRKDELLKREQQWAFYNGELLHQSISPYFHNESLKFYPL